MGAWSWAQHMDAGAAGPACRVQVLNVDSQARSKYMIERLANKVGSSHVQGQQDQADKVHVC